MLPVSPFAACRGVRVSMNNGPIVLPLPPPTHILRGGHIPRPHPHTHMHGAIVCACSMANTMLGEKEGKVPAPRHKRKLHAMRECATAVSDHAPLPTYARTCPSSDNSPKNCLLQMTNFTFFECASVGVCENGCYLFCFLPLLRISFRYTFSHLVSPVCLYCLTRCHSKFSH